MAEPVSTTSSMKLGKIDLGKKVGPLPIWAWGLIAGTIIGLYLYSRRGDTEDTSMEEEDAEFDAGLTEDGVGEGPGWTAFPPPTTPSPAAPDTYTNNREWATYAINLVNQQTSHNPAAVQNAISRYIAKQTLGENQVVIIGDAIRLAGAPPNPLPILRAVKNPGGGGGGGGVPGPKPRPTPGDSKWHLIKSKRESIAGINRRYYANPQSRQGDIFRANRKGHDRPGPTKGWMEGPNDIRVGHWLYIPGPTKNRRPKKS